MMYHDKPFPVTTKYDSEQLCEHCGSKLGFRKVQAYFEDAGQAKPIGIVHVRCSVRFEEAQRVARLRHMLRRAIRFCQEER